MNRHARTALLSALAGLPFALHAAVIPYSNSAGGTASVGANWTGGIAPGPADTAQFPALAGPYTVTFDALFPTTNFLQGNSGTISWTLATPHSTTQLQIGNDGVSNPVINLSGGTMTASGTGAAITVGRLAGTGSGTLNLSGASTLLRTTASNADILVGAACAGFMNITGGARATPADDFIIANNVGSAGTVTVSGAGSTVNTASATTGDVIAGLNGSATLTVQGSGTVSSAHDFLMAVNPGSSATVMVQDSGTPGSIAVANNCDIGRNTAAASAAGIAQLNLSGTSTFTVTGTTTVGDPDGGSGTLQMNGGTFSSGTLAFDPTNGHLTFNNGTVAITGGSLTLPPGGLLLNGSGGTPTLRLSAGATASIPTGITIGNSSTGRVEVLSGSSLTNAGGAFTIGSSGPANGSMLVDGVGSTVSFPPAGLFVGFAGTGTLDVQNGGHLNTIAGRIANSPGSHGTATITGAGSRWDMGSMITVGGSAFAVGGAGSLTISNGAVVTASDTIVWPGSTLTMNNGTLTNTSSATLDGNETLTNSTFSAIELLESNNTNITASGRFDAVFNNPSNFNARIALNGALDIGPGSISNFASAPGRFDWAGHLDIGTNSLSIRCPSIAGNPFARLGTVTINGGSITPITVGLGTALANGDSLTGTGTINGPMAIGIGANVSATGSNGFTFNGVVNALPAGTNFNLGGTKILFAGTSSYTGHGTINAAFTQVNNPAVITLDGNLTIGNGTSTCTAFFGGTFNIGANVLTINDTSAGTKGGNLIDIRGGRIICPNYELFSTSLNEELLGFGTIQGNFLNGEIVSPAGPSGIPTGQIEVTGTYTQVVGINRGTLNIDIDAGTQDKLTVFGNVTLGGTVNVQLVNGAVPFPGSSRVIVESNTGFILGTFTTANLPPRAVLQYDARTVSVLFPCTADVDNGEGRGTPDGGVTIDDLLYYLHIFEDGDLAADVDDGSGTGTLDGGITIDDLLYYLFRFETGC